MFAMQLEGAQDSPINVPLRRSRSKHHFCDPKPAFRRKRKVRIPKDFVWIGRRPGPSPLKRLKGKDRLTWHQWLCDWSTSLHKIGFTFNSQAMTSKRTAITDHGLRKRECIRLQNGTTAVFLYASVHALPGDQNVDLEPSPTVYHIVRGRRPDASAGARRLEDSSTATGIIPDVDLTGRTGFLVEFDGSLFGLDQHGVWKETTNQDVLALYRGYRANSSHLTKYRPRRRKAEMGKHLSDLGILDFDHCEHKFARIKELR